MTPMPYASSAPVPQPQMPSPEQLEEDKLIAEACSWEEISGVLHSDDRRNYTVDVETDATAFEDAEVEKQSRIEYIRAMTEMMQLWIPAIQGNPSLAPFAKELAIFGSGAFKPGRQFEEQLGDAFDQIQNMPPQPNPEAEKLKAEAERDDKKFAMEAQAKQGEAQARQQEAAAKAQERQQEMVFKQREFELKQRQMQAELLAKQQELEFKAQELQIKEQELVLKAQDAEMSRTLAAEQAAMDRDDRERQRHEAAEDRDYERGMREREFGLKQQSEAIKHQDTHERRAMDQEERQHQRNRETAAASNERSAEPRESAPAPSAPDLTPVLSMMADQNKTLLRALTAPKKVLRGPKGEAIGMRIDMGEGD